MAIDDAQEKRPSKMNTDFAKCVTTIFSNRKRTHTHSHVMCCAQHKKIVNVIYVF